MAKRLVKKGKKGKKRKKNKKQHTQIGLLFNIYTSNGFAYKRIRDSKSKALLSLIMFRDWKLKL